MVKEKKEGYRVPDSKKKACPYCGQLISRQGWRMHMDRKHREEEFIAFDGASGTASKPKKKEEKSGASSFRGREEGGEERGEEKERSDDDDNEFWGD